MPANAVMCKMTVRAALHVLLVRMAFAQDAFEVFGWKAGAVFTRAELEARDDEFDAVMAGGLWPKFEPETVRLALMAVVRGAYFRWMWAFEVLFAELDVMDEQSGGETDAEA